MRGARIAGLLIRQARLRRDWSQDGLCLGICTPSYLSKIEQGKAEPSPEVTELLLRRLGLVWIPEPEDLKPCWNALLSGSPGFFLCYEQLVLPQQERLACSPLAADILLLAAFYTDTMQPLSEEWEPFLSTRQLALQRALQGRWDEAARLEPLPLLSSLHGKALYTKGEYTTAIEVLRDAYRSAADAGYPHMMLSCRILIGNCYSDLGRMEEMMTHFSVAEHLAEALGDTDSLASLRYNTAATQLQLGQPEKALPYFSSLPHPSFLDLHKLAICHELLRGIGFLLGRLLVRLLRSLRFLRRVLVLRILRLLRGIGLLLLGGASLSLGADSLGRGLGQRLRLLRGKAHPGQHQQHHQGRRQHQRSAPP